MQVADSADGSSGPVSYCVMQIDFSFLSFNQSMNSLLQVADSADGTDEAEDETLTLQSLFKKGQYVITKVDSVEKVENIHKG